MIFLAGGDSEKKEIRQKPQLLEIGRVLSLSKIINIINIIIYLGLCLWMPVPPVAAAALKVPQKSTSLGPGQKPQLLEIGRVLSLSKMIISFLIVLI